MCERPKIVEYLLSQEHPDGKSKAEFFRRFGFEPSSWQVMADALRNQAIRHEVQEVVASPYGTRYVIDGPVETPDGRNPVIRTIWILDRDASVPRFITAYPR